MAAAPWWLKAIVRAERALGAPIARATNSDESARALLALGGVVRAGADIGELLASRAVHLMSLPSRRDVQRLEIKVERLRRTVEDLAHTLEETGTTDGPPTRR